MRSLLERCVVAQLRRDLRRIEWVGDVPSVPPGRPLVIFANHQAYYDALVLGFFVRRILKRAPCVWMEEYDRFPAFGRLGALPFPLSDAHRRATTIRRTVTRLEGNPGLAFIYFPERRLHPYDEELLDFPADTFSRLERAFPPCYWWPVALRVSTSASVRPIATLIGGRITGEPPGAERDRLAELVWRLREQPTPRQTLLEGRRGPDERWAWLARFFGTGRA